MSITTPYFRNEICYANCLCKMSITKPTFRNEKFYTCCDEPYLDITFNITMRRKTLFYTVSYRHSHYHYHHHHRTITITITVNIVKIQVNLIIPCMGISFLTVLTFYLPSDSGEKVEIETCFISIVFVIIIIGIIVIGIIFIRREDVLIFCTTKYFYVIRTSIG